MSSSRWIPLESNPEILNSWAFKAGLTLKDEFSDIYGLDAELLSMVPQPVKAVVLLFPLTKDFNAKREAQNAKRRQERGGDSIDPTVFWMKQTISNACGTMAILHALANTDVTLVPHSPVAKFIEEAKGKTPLERAALLEHTPLFADIHAEMASEGQSAVPQDLDTDLHFTCFVRAPGAECRKNAEVTGRDWRVIELDGTRDGPVDHGPCTEENFLQIVAGIVNEDFISKSTSLQFNLMSLGAAL